MSQNKRLKELCSDRDEKWRRVFMIQIQLKEIYYESCGKREKELKKLKSNNRKGK